MQLWEHGQQVVASWALSSSYLFCLFALGHCVSVHQGRKGSVCPLNSKCLHMGSLLVPILLLSHVIFQFFIFRFLCDMISRFNHTAVQKLTYMLTVDV